MGRTTHFEQEQLNRIVELYTKCNYSQEKIAKMYGVSSNKIASILKKLGISNYIPEENKDKVVENYVVKKMGLQAAGREFGYSQRVVETILKQRGVHKRTYVESKQTLRKYSVNDDFFKHQSHDMAYILGFIAADGCVSDKENLISIQLQKRDQELIEKIKKITNSSHPIKNYITKLGRDTCKISIWSSEWKKDLAIYNITPKKTFILQPPERLDKQFYIDFIRGYFDGDGSITTNKLGFEIVGASKSMMTWIRDVFANQYGITNNGLTTSVTENNVTMYKFGIYNKQQIKKIRNLLYNDSDCLCLCRKKDKMFSIE